MRVDNSRIFEFDDHHQLNKVKVYRQLGLENGFWRIEDGREVEIFENRPHTSQSSQVTFQKNTFPFVFKKELNHPKYAGFSDIITEIHLKRQGAVNYEADLFALYQKIAAILAIFVMILLALPFSLGSGRKSNVRAGIVFSIILGFCFWLIDQIFFSFNSAGIMSAEFAAFGANFLFAMLALSLIYLRRV
jgi:lipopolysaccharide export system permease protein